MLIRLLVIGMITVGLVLSGCSRDDAEEPVEDTREAVEEAPGAGERTYNDLADDEEGETMRERLGDAYESAEDSAMSMWAEAVAATQGAMHAAREGLQSAREEGEDAWEEALVRAEEAREDAREAVERAREEGAEAADNWEERAESVWADAEEAWQDLQNWDPTDRVEDEEEADDDQYEEMEAEGESR